MASPYLRGRPVLAPLIRSSRLSAQLPRRAFLPVQRLVSTSPTPATPSPSAAASAATAATPSSPETPTKTTTPPAPAAAASQSSSSTDSLPISRLRTAFLAASVGVSLFVLYIYGTDTRASAHRFAVPPLIRTLFPDAEDAHHIGTQALKVLYTLGLHPRDRVPETPDLAVGQVFDGSDGGATLSLGNPIGISAGLDKDADIPDALFALGAAVVEVGGCTPRPQAGNPQPRVFRVPSIDGMINRYGLNSIGADAMAARLRARLRAFARANGLTEEDILAGKAVVGGSAVPTGSLRPGRLLAVQVAKNKDTDEHDVRAVADDYAYCVKRLAPYADVLVVNVSSPNTPGLRDLQAVEPLTKILSAVVEEAQATTNPAPASRVLAPARAVAPRVMVKVSPDEDEDAQIDGIIEAVFASGVDGIIVGNTTKRRTGLVPGQLKLESSEQQALAETGGFSGPAMFGRTLALVKRYRARLDEETLRAGAAQSQAQSQAQTTEEAQAQTAETPGTKTVAAAAAAAGNGPTAVARKTLFASGGVTNGEQAHQLLDAGANVAMLYTGLVYGGAGTVTRIKQELRERVRKE